MVKWGKRLLGRNKSSTLQRGGRKTDYSRRRCDYDNSDEDSSQGSYEEDYEEESAAWDGRDDDANIRGEYYDEEEDYRDDDDDVNELVTRDQVLGELRAQAAAEALGKSLEQMGYNLDNCDSFYSLSDREDKGDQRYKVEQQERADILPTVKKSGSGNKKGKRSKSKKKKSKSHRSTGALSDDEDDSYYENYSRANHHSFGDYETYNDSSSEESDSYYGDETTTFATGRESGVTGKSSRFSRFTGKKSAKSRKSLKYQSRKKRKHVRDHDSYYSRGTEWTPGDSSDSTLSSVSSSEEESETSAYTEPTERRERKSASRRPKSSKKKRNMDAINEEEEDPLSEESSVVKMERLPKKKVAKKPQTMKRRSDSSRYSNSSQIGAMRSLDTLSDADSDTTKEAGEVERLSVVEETVEKGKKQKQRKMKPEDSRNKKKHEAKKSTSQSKNRSRKVVEAVVSDEESSSESVAADDLSSNLELDSIEKPSTKKGKDRKSEDPSHRSDKKSAKRRDVAKKSDMSASCASEDKSNLSGKHTGADKGSKHERRKSSKQQRETTNDGSQTKQQKTNKEKKDNPEKVSQKSSRGEKTGHDESKQQTEKSTAKHLKRSVATADDASQAQASVSSKTVSSKKFWPRQFLSLRKKKNDEDATVKEPEDIQKDDGIQVNDKQEKANEQSQANLPEVTSLQAEQESDEEQESVAEQESDAEQESETEEVASTERDASLNSSKKRDSSPQRSRKHGKERRSENDETSRKASNKQETGVISPPFTHSEKEKDVHQKEVSKEKPSLGVLEMAAMAAMIPLAPLAAAYSCYTAEGTQTLIKNSAEVVDSACSPVEHKKISETRKDRDGESHYTSSSRKKRRSSQKKQEAMKKKIDGDDQASNNDEKKDLLAEIAETTKSTKPTELADNNTVSSKPSKISKAASKLSKASKTSEAKSSRSKKALTKILPQRLSKNDTKYDPPQAQIQEEAEGFESFLPGSMDLPFLSTPDTLPKASQSHLQVPEPVPVPQKPQDPSIVSKPIKRKNKRSWLPKLPFKKAEHKQEEVISVEAPAKPAKDGQNATEKVTRSVDRVPFLKVSQKEANARKEDSRVPSKRRTARATDPDDEITPFSCTKDSAMCGRVDETENDDMDRSLLSDFENIALDALRKKSQKEVKNKGAAFDPSKATHEDLLKYYDLEQTLSDVADARQTLEQAYGVHTGGNSFDHTIDEQLVELLTHMAEMDQDDVVEIEAAIQKLKRHARKLGISERDLLFSVKSAEESVLSPTSGDGYRGKLNEPPSFSDKMIDAFEGYFQGQA